MPADPQTIQGYNVVTLLKRLEAATSRLEDLTSAQKAHVDERGPQNAAATKAGVDAPPRASAAAAAPAADLPKWISEFDVLIKTHVEPFVATSKELDATIGEQAEAFKKAFDAQRDFLAVTAVAKKPDPTSPAYAELTKPISSHVQSIMNIREKTRDPKVSSHLATVAEGAPLVGWVASDLPLPLIGDFKDSAQFYSNRVLKDFKAVDPKHVEWVKGFNGIADALQAYVKEFHTTGPSWKVGGIPVEEAMKNQSSKSGSAPAAAPAAAPAPATGGGPPPPPPPPPPPASIYETDSAPAAPAGGMGAVFADLSKGEAVTAGLRKVDKSEMTHKNPDLRKQDPVGASGKAARPLPPKKPGSLSKASGAPAPKQRPAKTELLDTKWFVENYEGDQNIVIEGEMNQGVMIENCNNSTVQIKGKVSAVSLNNCKKLGLLVENLVSGVDVIRCKDYAIQVTGVTPMITIDQSDGGQIYLSKESIGAEVYTSQTTSLNINIPTEDGDYEEVPVPEQLIHKIVNGKLVTSVVDHSSG
ncbi:Adenylyl cyclase-associated protein [Yarrowia sp. C11]|nr:Adenylyl cyclase-associated protein [Yarrowia sp. E02]KAG5372956.1 Adenylyl cyclase-associated protein [Yarrowia sp. C11]